MVEESDRRNLRRAQRNPAVSGLLPAAPEVPQQQARAPKREYRKHGQAAMVQQFTYKELRNRRPRSEGVPLPGRLPAAMVNQRVIQHQWNQLKSRDGKGRGANPKNATDTDHPRYPVRQKRQD